VVGNGDASSGDLNHGEGSGNERKGCGGLVVPIAVAATSVKRHTIKQNGTQ